MRYISCQAPFTPASISPCRSTSLPSKTQLTLTLIEEKLYPQHTRPPEDHNFLHRQNTRPAFDLSAVAVAHVGLRLPQMGFQSSEAQSGTCLECRPIHSSIYLFSCLNSLYFTSVLGELAGKYRLQVDSVLCVAQCCACDVTAQGSGQFYLLVHSEWNTC